MTIPPMPNILRLLSWIMLAAAVVSCLAGLFWPGAGEQRVLTNVHGDSVTLFGQGLYANESLFMAPILTGSDLAVLVLVVPLFAAAVLGWMQGRRMAAFLYPGLLAMLAYHGASLALGVSYNSLFPVYIVQTSSGVFALILTLKTLSGWHPAPVVIRALPRRGTAAFLMLAGAGLLVWLTDVIPSAMTGAAPQHLGMSTTSVTYVLDLGVLAPASFAAAWMVWRHRPFGYVLAVMLMVANLCMGAVVVAQTMTQRAYGVVISTAELLTFVGVFVLLGLIACAILFRVLRVVAYEKGPAGGEAPS